MKCHKSEYELRRLFHQAKSDVPEVSFEDTKSTFLNATNGSNLQHSSESNSSFFSIKSIVIMTTILSVIGVGVILFSSISREPQNLDVEQLPEHELVVVDENKVSTYIEEEKLGLTQVEEINVVEISEENFQMPVQTQIETEQNIEDFVKIESDKTEKLNNVESSYRFPILTEDEVKANNKRKSKLIKQVLKMDKKKFAFIPAGTIKIDANSVSVRSFSMQRAEVSNVNYRTFLFDLLINNRKNDFLIAKPDQSQWTKLNSDNFTPMAEYYFSHPAYDEYPVNNINREGAEMYCKWLTLEVNRILKQKGKKEINDIRIPTNVEWTYAAKGGVEDAAYPWGGSYLRNDHGCYLANFNPENEEMNEDGMEITAPVWSYAPNKYGLFCMSGNVAEMVYYGSDKSQLGAKGGSWMSPSSEIQIDGTDPFRGIDSANVNIGFRVVISLL
jgi:formylglycine-generating enzyme required for sulfatase activity